MNERVSVDQRLPAAAAAPQLLGDLMGHVGWWERTCGALSAGGWGRAGHLLGAGTKGSKASASVLPCRGVSSQGPGPATPSGESVRLRVCLRRPQSHTWGEAWAGSPVP